MDNEPVSTHTPSQETKKNWQPGTKFWQILTGHKTVYTPESIDIFFKEGKLHFPKSELEFFGYEEIDNKGNRIYRKLQNPILVQPGINGFSPQEVLHQSWLGFQDSLRMYVFNEEGLKALEEKLISSNITFKPLPGNLGIIVETEIPAIIKKIKNRFFNLGKIKIKLPSKEEFINEEKIYGVFLFLN